MPRRYFNVEPKRARLLEPGDVLPVEKVISSVVKTTADVLVTFDDGSNLRLDYDDALLVASPLPNSRAAVAAEAATAAGEVLAAAEPTGTPADEAEG